MGVCTPRWRRSRTISRQLAVVVPFSKDTWVLCCTVGPSASGSLKGTPSSSKSLYGAIASMMSSEAAASG
jgi:hypothetical protein